METNPVSALMGTPEAVKRRTLGANPLTNSILLIVSRSVGVSVSRVSAAETGLCDQPDMSIPCISQLCITDEESTGIILWEEIEMSKKRCPPPTALLIVND